ncbi:uncharacterized protein Tco025E_10035 [Trypanosoma conorhini]|uniref:Secreted protein n=1 Tax=Trypanosoma conorhini TaxID=83891 RepID=A0A3R7MW49_9TRYP|nr:uncharacterized protein Tco025E_10035 [Trypanosoma conorhini]RNE96224.1 hypothetical protein Tco025E_10035 [Trypanosoma conorhini]
MNYFWAARVGVSLLGLSTPAAFCRSGKRPGAPHPQQQQQQQQGSRSPTHNGATICILPQHHFGVADKRGPVPGGGRATAPSLGRSVRGRGAGRVRAPDCGGCVCAVFSAARTFGRRGARCRCRWRLRSAAARRFSGGGDFRQHRLRGRSPANVWLLRERRQR